MRSPQSQQIPVITSDYIMNLHTMLEKLTEKVDQIGVTLESRTVPTVAPIPPAPAKLEVSLSFLAAATKTSKSTIERRIASKRLPKPHADAFNGYRYWFKSELPKNLHEQIDAHYESTKVSK